MNRPLFVLLSAVAIGSVVPRPALAQLAPPTVPPTVPSLAQPATPDAPLQGPSPKRTHLVKLKNVPANIMAFWLDPKNNSRPRELGTSRSSSGERGQNPLPGFTLPAGVDQVVAIEPQNSVLVFGTEPGATEFSATIAALDQPLRYVEIEVRWVEIQPEAARAFALQSPGNGPNFGSAPQVTPPTATGPQFGMVRGNFAATLGALITQNRAKVLSSIRSVALNGQSAQVSNFSASRATVNFQGDALAVAPFFEGTTQIGLEYDLIVTPTIHSDKTVTISATTSSKLKIKTAIGTELDSVQPLTRLQSVVNVRDGDTIALGGLSSRPAPAVPDTRNSQSNLMLFLTARVVRPAAK